MIKIAKPATVETVHGNVTEARCHDQVSRAMHALDEETNGRKTRPNDGIEMGDDQSVLDLEVRLKFSNLRERFSIGDCRVAKRRIGALEIVGTRAALHWLAAPGCT